ncbi:MAG: zinc-ribbon domain-containing protein [Magnetococcus sp. YQC-3]
MSNSASINLYKASGHNFGNHFPEQSKEWHPEKNGSLTPFDFAPHSNTKVWWKCRRGHDWIASIGKRSRTGCPTCRREFGIPKKIASGHNLGALFPEQAKEWHPEKNGSLTPFNFSPHSRKKVWWVCRMGHERLASIGYRSRSGCPECNEEFSMQRINASGYNFGRLFPERAKEWHPEKNGTLTPFDVAPRSGKKVWWRCERGHEWESCVYSRTIHKCPKCYKHASIDKIEGGYNFGTLFPSQSKEWHSEKNGNLTPYQVTPYSSMKVWWLCAKGHEWISAITSRRRSNCPICYKLSKIGKKIVRRGSFGMLCPDKAKEWHPEKNGDLTPFDVSVSSERKVWWLCKMGHEWEGSVYLRRNHNCYACSRQIMHANKISGGNNFGTLYPDKSKEWHPEKNIGLSPFDFVPSSSIIIWWKCESGHEWQSMIRTRTTSNCPVCWKIKRSKTIATYIKIKSQAGQNAGRVPLDVMLNQEASRQSNVLHQDAAVTVSTGINLPIETLGTVTLPKTAGSEESLITCLICGIQFPSLNWHLVATHQMNADAYRQRFNLPNDYQLRIQMR